MTPLELLPWLTLVLSSIAVLGHLKGFFSSGETKLADQLKTIKDDLAEAEKTLVDHQRRIQTIEDEMRHLPDRESQHRIELNVSQMSSRIDVLAESLKPIKSNNELITELLKRQASK
jgi:septal ring factor EnvC (AmiA/AmiB activator)